MSWRISFGGVEFNSDDLTLDELEAVEKASGTPWSLSNPLREIKVAQGYLAVAMMRSGASDEDVSTRLKALTLAGIKNCFEWLPETRERDDSEPDPTRVRRTSQTGVTSDGSSSGAPAGSGGRRRKHAGSG